VEAEYGSARDGDAHHLDLPAGRTLEVGGRRAQWQVIFQQLLRFELPSGVGRRSRVDAATISIEFR
jgi:hypothetical protein